MTARIDAMLGAGATCTAACDEDGREQETGTAEIARDQRPGPSLQWDAQQLRMPVGLLSTAQREQVRRPTRGPQSSPISNALLSSI